MNPCPKGGKHVPCDKETCPVSWKHCKKCGLGIFR